MTANDTTGPSLVWPERDQGSPPALVPSLLELKRLHTDNQPILPALVVAAGDRAGARSLDFAGTIRNPHTCRAYGLKCGTAPEQRLRAGWAL